MIDIFICSILQIFAANKISLNLILLSKLLKHKWLPA
jgi:hypothetical protein